MLSDKQSEHMLQPYNLLSLVFVTKNFVLHS